MPARDVEQALLLLAHAQSDIQSALALLGTPEIELPAGVRQASGCTHPKWRQTFGGHGYCPDCGAER